MKISKTLEKWQNNPSDKTSHYFVALSTYLIIISTGKSLKFFIFLNNHAVKTSENCLCSSNHPISFHSDYQGNIHDL
jgi:hypothetical protein